MLTELQKQKLPNLFAVHDLNRDGVINRDDFEEYTARIAGTRGWGPESAEYKQLLSHFMTFWGGLEVVAKSIGAHEVTMTAWLEYWDRILSTPGVFEQIVAPIGQTVFSIVDHDGDGSIAFEEYAAMYQHSGFPEEDIRLVFGRLDTNQDGRLSLDEFMTLVGQFFGSSNPADPGNLLFGPVPAIMLSA
jgi:Ca2+-binding EF-hand superfamily protein